MQVVEGENGSLNIEGPIQFGGFGDAGRHHDYQSVSLTRTGQLPAKFARGFATYPKIEKLWLWCDVYRTALPHILALPKLAVLDILCITRPGRRLCQFDGATNLRTFRCNTGLSESDLIAISTAPGLEELGAQSSGLTRRALDALLSIASLTAIDLEDAGVTDDLAAQFLGAPQLLTLELGNNPISDLGLSKLCSMVQLRGLDIWQTNVTQSGLKQLERLENLEFLSIGKYSGEAPAFTGDRVIPVLDSLPSLNRVWLDGVTLTSEQREMLEDRYEYFRN